MMLHNLFEEVVKNSITEVKLSGVDTYDFNTCELKELATMSDFQFASSISPLIFELSNNKYISVQAVEIDYLSKTECFTGDRGSVKECSKIKQTALVTMDFNSVQPLREVYPIALDVTLSNLRDNNTSLHTTIKGINHCYNKDFENSELAVIQGLTVINYKSIAIMGADGRIHSYGSNDRPKAQQLIEIWENVDSKWHLNSTIKFGDFNFNTMDIPGIYYFPDSMISLSDGTIMILKGLREKTEQHGRSGVETTKVTLSQIKKEKEKDVLDFKPCLYLRGAFTFNGCLFGSTNKYNLAVTKGDNVFFYKPLDNENPNQIGLYYWNPRDRKCKLAKELVHSRTVKLTGDNGEYEQTYSVQNAIQVLKDGVVIHSMSHEESYRNWIMDPTKIYNIHNGVFTKIAEHNIQDKNASTSVVGYIAAFHDGTVLKLNSDYQGCKLNVFPECEEHDFGTYNYLYRQPPRSHYQCERSKFVFNKTFPGGSFLINFTESFKDSYNKKTEANPFCIGEWGSKPVTNDQIDRLLNKLRVGGAVNRLDFSDTPLTMSNASNLAYTLKDNKNIESLLLNSAELTNEHMQKILPGLKNNFSITELHLDRNNISGFLKSQARFYVARNKAKKASDATKSIIIPQEYRCRLTGNIMKDPVMAADGETYDRAVIMEWIKTNNNSPVDNTPLEHHMLVQNKGIKRGIDTFVEQNPLLQQSGSLGVPAHVTEKVLTAAKLSDKDAINWVTEDLQKLITEGPDLLGPSLKDESKAIVLSTHKSREDLFKIIIDELGEYFWLQKPIELDGGLTLFRVAAMSLENDGIECLAKRLELTRQDYQEQLHYAIECDNERLMRVCLDFGADVNYVDDIGYRSLHHASVNGSTALVELLLNRGAKPDEVISNESDLNNFEKQAPFGDTALHHAIRNKNEAAALKIIQYRPDFEAKNSEGYTALLFAIYASLSNVAMNLVSAGANIRVKAENGDTTLHAACRVGAKDLALLIKSRGIDPSVENASNQRASDLARLNGFEELADIIDGLSISTPAAYQTQTASLFGNNQAGFFQSGVMVQQPSPLLSLDARTHALNSFAQELLSFNLESLDFSFVINKNEFVLSITDHSEQNNKLLFRAIGESLKRCLGTSVIRDKEAKKGSLIITTEDTDASKDIRDFLKEAGLNISKLDVDEQKMLTF